MSGLSTVYVITEQRVVFIPTHVTAHLTHFLQKAVFSQIYGMSGI